MQYQQYVGNAYDGQMQSSSSSGYGMMNGGQRHNKRGKCTTKTMITCGAIALGLVAAGIAIVVLYDHTYVEFSFGRTINGRRKGSKRGIGKVFTMGGAKRLAFDQEMVVYSIGNGVSSVDTRTFAQPVKDEHIFGLVSERHFHAHGEMTASGAPMMPSTTGGSASGAVAPTAGGPMPASNPTTVKNPFIGSGMPDMGPIDAYIASKRNGAGF